MPARERGERGDDDRVERDQDRDRDRDRRRRSRSRDRPSERRSRRSRSRSRSRSPGHKRRRSSPGRTSTAGPSGKHEEPPMSAMSEEDRQMKELLGFGSFHSTKGKKVDGNNVGAVHVIMKRKYRQYMNRKGGFNRPLDFVA